MSVSDDLQNLADLDEVAAHKALSAQFALGPRPDAPPVAVTLWKQQTSALQGQIQSLTAQAVQLSAQSVIDALAGNADDISQIQTVIADAKTAVALIAEISKLLTTVGHILDLGLAVLALAAAPSPAAAKTLFEKGETLAGDL